MSIALIVWCRPSHEGRGLKPLALLCLIVDASRPSHEGRGLKLCHLYFVALRASRPSHEGRGLKPYKNKDFSWQHSRPSHEGRGLKLRQAFTVVVTKGSPLTRGAWIETSHGFLLGLVCR